MGFFQGFPFLGDGGSPPPAENLLILLPSGKIPTKKKNLSPRVFQIAVRGEGGRDGGVNSPSLQ